jgi:hypothetical protein
MRPPSITSVLVVRSLGAGVAAGKLVADGNRSGGGIAARHHLFAGLARANDAALGIELVRRLGDAVEVEFGGELHPGVARADHRADDRFDLFAKAAFIGELAFVGGRAAGIVGAAVGQKPSGLVDHRHPLRLQSVDGAGDEMPDGAHLLRF